VALTLKVALLPTATVCEAGWTAMPAGTFTVKRATLLVRLLAPLVSFKAFTVTVPAFGALSGAVVAPAICESLAEPFGDCRLEYVQDLSRLQDVYGFRAEHPMIGDPCSKAVFDLMKYGAGMDGLVRGDIVQGSGLRPPIAIEIKVQGDKIVAVRSE
jgi:hypothetical protein